MSQMKALSQEITMLSLLGPKKGKDIVAYRGFCKIWKRVSYGFSDPWKVAYQ